MDIAEAKILLRNLLKRIKPQEDGSHMLPGVLTDDEIEALKLAIEGLGSSATNTHPAAKTHPSPSVLPASPKAPIPAFPSPEPDVSVSVPDVHKDAPKKSTKIRVELDLSSLSAAPAPQNVRLCLDFGTAMSKATLVRDNGDTGAEEIHVLRLGVPGDQEEDSEVMLISSVFIDGEGKLWFGKAAVDRSLVEGGDGSRQRMDNIKRRLSEDGWEEKVSKRLNPTDQDVTYGDMVLAYLMFMTWAVNNCLEGMGYPWNLPRRFAMPCLAGEKGRETVIRLRRCVGEAQVLADTFYSRLKEGIALEDFLAALAELRRETRNFYYVAEDVTEPLGVAGSIISWTAAVDNLMLVVDIGAGTSDLSLYRIHINPSLGQNEAMEIEGTAKGLTEAGNHLDRILIELIIKKSGITSDEPMWVNVRGALELRIRDYKESLFNDGYVVVSLLNGMEVEIQLDEFLQLDAVANFGANLRKAMVEILEAVDPSLINWILANPARNLVVALTGGGAELPMVKKLAEESIRIGNLNVPVARALPFPKWLRQIDANLEADYPRVAVSLGGARRQLIKRGSAMKITAGDVTQTPKLGGYYTKGN